MINYLAKSLIVIICLLSAFIVYGAEPSKAYQAQAKLVAERLKSDELAGYKAGLTSKAGQARFKVDGPVHAALFKSGELEGAPILKLSDYTRLMLEIELGFVLKRDIKEPLTDMETLKAAIDYLLPVVELPDVAFKDMSTVSGSDLIRSNVASNAFIRGKAISEWQGLDINNLTASIRHNEKLLVAGKGSDASGDQWQALMWLINERLAMGDELKQGQLLITGALGKMIPAQKGQFKAEIESLGMIEFRILP